MKRWQVETRAVVIRTYYVDAEDEKSAEAASCDTTCDHEEDDDEETMSITEVVPEFSCKFCQDSKIEEVAGGHGTILELPCPHCSVTSTNDCGGK